MQRNKVDLLLIFLFVLVTAGFGQYKQINIDNYIQVAEVVGENQLPQSPTLIPFASFQSAVADPESASSYYESLNGFWKFKFEETPYIFPKNFYEKNFNDSKWDEIKVPSVWQTEGYDSPIYRNVPMEFAPYDPPKVPKELNPAGCYRRIFDIKKDWIGKKIILHLDGVKSNAFIWINGNYIGYDEGGMTPAEFDITNFVEAKNNQITVLVTRWSSGSYLEDQDMWRYSGIFRDIFIYSKSLISLSDLTIVTDFDESYLNANLIISVSASSSEAISEKFKIRFTLVDSAKNKIFTETASFDNLKTMLRKEIIKPKQWSDEKPYLYRLIVELLNSKNEILEIISKKVGFRELELIDGKACLNGKPIYFRGVNRHEHHPDYSGAVTKEMMIKDILLMKQFNINSVRTCHYPDSPVWYDLCDEYGILLLDEINAECHYREDWFPTLDFYEDSFMDRFVGMIQRDKNHPSVVIWSTGNECGLADIHFKMAEYARTNDPTRFLMHQSNVPDGEAPYVDIIGPRYPTVSRLRHIALRTAKPVVLGEYAHAMGNSLGQFDELWNLIYSMDKLQGGFIWDWVDQGLNRKLILTPDQSENKITSALFGNPKIIDGKLGKAIKLSGLDDWVEVYNHPVFDELKNNLTIEFWIKPDKWFIENPIVTRSNQFGISQRHPDSLSFYINAYNNCVTASLPENWQDNWHYVKAEFAGGSMMLFIDGQLKVQKQYDPNLQYAHYPINIGRDISQSPEQHLGWISNCAIDELVISGEIQNQKKILLNLKFDEISEDGKFVYYGSSSFVCNGIVFCDRTPQPELYQVKKSQAPIQFTLEDNTLKIYNYYCFTNLNELDFNWFLYKDGKLEENGSIKVDCPPLCSTAVQIPVNKAAVKQGEYIFEISACNREAKTWAPKSHEISFEQFVLKAETAGNLNSKQTSIPEVNQDENNIFIKLNPFEYRINKKTGELTFLENSNFLFSGPELNVWRAPISNEKVFWGRAEAEDWYRSGLNRLKLDSTDFIYSNDIDHLNCTVAQFFRLPENEDYIINYFSYCFYPDGSLKINQRTDFQGYFNYDWLPRIGMKFKLSKSFYNVSWYGRGPFETYPDRKTGAKLGIYSLNIDSFYIPYVQPEDFGNRTDVRWLELINNTGNNIKISSAVKFNFSVSKFSDVDRAVYPFQLQESDEVTLYIDYNITGVGDTPVPVLPKYRVYPGSFDYSITLLPSRKDR